MALEYEMVAVTPDIAEDWLATMGVNRRLTEGNVEKIAEAMMSGHWHDDGSPIRFNEAGQMIDGQHRCMAISMTGVTQELLVVRGVKNEAMTTIDVGKSRTRADVLQIHDPEIKSANTVAAIASIVIRWMNGSRGNSLRNAYVSNDAIVRFYEENKDALSEATRQARKAQYHVRAVTGQSLGLCAFLFSLIDEEDAKFFWDRLIDGQSLDKGNPILTLRTLLQRKAVSGRDNYRADYGAALIIKAWNAYRRGDRMEILRFNPGGAKPEAFPEPI